VSTPYLAIDLDAIEHNARVIVELCAARGVEVTAVTKGVCGHPDIARAMLRGGVSSLADSRLENVQRLQAAGIDAAGMLLRLPALSAVEQVVETVATSLNSELAVLAGLSAAASARGRVHNVLLMVELGDLREGIPPRELLAFAGATLKLPGIHLQGLGANLACFAGVVPTVDNMRQLAGLADAVEQACGISLERVSGINSSGLELLAAGGLPRRINHARIGEAILLGRETMHRKPWPGTRQNAFILQAEVLELKRKASLPRGARSEDAFGGRPQFVADRGEVWRALLNVGREDVYVDGLTPLDGRLAILGATSGYLVMDVTPAAGSLRVGDEVAFALNYGALLAAMTSEYVEKRPRGNSAALTGEG
jgi:predicted amino acid racemase